MMIENDHAAVMMLIWCTCDYCAVWHVGEDADGWYLCPVCLCDH